MFLWDNGTVWGRTCWVELLVKDIKLQYWFSQSRGQVCHHLCRSTRWKPWRFSRGVGYVQNIQPTENWYGLFRIRIRRTMSYEQFMKSEAWVSTQIMMQHMAHKESQKRKVYERRPRRERAKMPWFAERLDAYQVLLGKFENFKNEQVHVYRRLVWLCEAIKIQDLLWFSQNLDRISLVNPCVFIERIYHVKETQRKTIAGNSLRRSGAFSNTVTKVGQKETRESWNMQKKSASKQEKLSLKKVGPQWKRPRNKLKSSQFQ